MSFTTGGFPLDGSCSTNISWCLRLGHLLPSSTAPCVAFPTFLCSLSSYLCMVLRAFRSHVNGVYPTCSSLHVLTFALVTSGSFGIPRLMGKRASSSPNTGLWRLVNHPGPSSPGFKLPKTSPQTAAHLGFTCPELALPPQIRLLDFSHGKRTGKSASCF